ncbi:hypothetical protein [Dolosigranulum savutiense]|uniref:Uncharacterized protein n=1 Tax=Dolosigranulum savutiense TaxID=3110288 RepID=A0AB74TKF4_9LACT
MMILITEPMTTPVMEPMIQHQELMMELATQYQEPMVAPIMELMMILITEPMMELVTEWNW